jgi:hypothetical protein
MPTLTIYHNCDARFMPYQDGHQLVAVMSHRLAASVSHDAHGAADWAFHTFNIDLDQLEASRDTRDGETAFLAACVYRLLGHRSLSVGDVIHVQDEGEDHWLACEPSGWRRIAPPSTTQGQTLTTAVYERMRSPQTDAGPTQQSFTRDQVGEALNQAADEILDAVDADAEGLRDALNLVVNATASYLTGEAETLREVVEQNYSEDYDTVLSQIETAL